MGAANHLRIDIHICRPHHLRQPHLVLQLPPHNLSEPTYNHLRQPTRCPALHHQLQLPPPPPKSLTPLPNSPLPTTENFPPPSRLAHPPPPSTFPLSSPSPTSSAPQKPYTKRRSSAPQK